jgi:hypothetical protein
MRSAMIRRHCVCRRHRGTAPPAAGASRQSATPPPVSPIASRISSPARVRRVNPHRRALPTG